VSNTEQLRQVTVNERFFSFKAIMTFIDKCQFTYDLYIHTVYKTQYRHGRFIRKKTIYWVGKDNEQICDILADDSKHVNNGIFHDMIIHDDHVEHYNRDKLLAHIRAQLFKYEPHCE
jgi:hypothetical protein